MAHAELVPCFDSFLTVTVTVTQDLDIDIDIVSHPQPQERLTSIFLTQKLQHEELLAHPNMSEMWGSIINAETLLKCYNMFGLLIE